ncbi:MAG: Gfo/Idh/MocA family oxidoreductase [Candidatus Desulfofervidus auxilii]|nr:Gfo/Idh/MocA family oxidoreductase [Candidatus Desulfofervidus auxilii]
MKKLKIGIIGCGKQAEKHILSLKKIPNISLVLSDINPEIAENLAKKTGASWTKSVEEILNDFEVKAVVICTPTPTHIELIKEAINAGKDVFCEKPLCEYQQDPSELKELIKNTDRIVMIGYIYRFVPVFEEAYRLIREQSINGISLVFGKILSAYFRLGGRGSHQVWKHKKATGGGAINEMLVHMVDLANWYFGPLKNIEVISYDLRCPKRIINGEEIIADAEDFVMIRCYGQNDVEIYCQADLITPAFTQYVEIQAENGSFMGSIQADMPSYIFLKESRGGYPTGKTPLNYGYRNVWDIQMLAFIQAILTREPLNKNTIEDSIELHRIMKEIKKQVEK